MTETPHLFADRAHHMKPVGDDATLLRQELVVQRRAIEHLRALLRQSTAKDQNDQLRREVNELRREVAALKRVPAVLSPAVATQGVPATTIDYLLKSVDVLFKNLVTYHAWTKGHVQHLALFTDELITDRKSVV